MVPGSVRLNPLSHTQPANMRSLPDMLNSLLIHCVKFGECRSDVKNSAGVAREEELTVSHNCEEGVQE